MRADAVTPELREYILKRDRVCFIYRLKGPVHHCRTRFNERHRPDDLNKLELDHFNDGYGKMGKRAPSDKFHLAAMCGLANFQNPDRLVRAAEREYVRIVEGSDADEGD